jgi:alpha-beta hydrolase superfamily lysophospholipase
VLPKFQLAPLPASGISTNAQVHNLYRTDPLIYHGGVQVRWGFETLQALDAIAATLESISFPFLIMHGDDDTIISPSARAPPQLCPRARPRSRTALWPSPGSLFRPRAPLGSLASLRRVPLRVRAARARSACVARAAARSQLTSDCAACPLARALAPRLRRRPLARARWLCDERAADGSKELYARAASTDKTIKTYAGLRHEILNEPKAARHRVIGDISEWIEARLRVQV